MREVCSGGLKEKGYEFIRMQIVLPAKKLKSSHLWIILTSLLILTGCASTRTISATSTPTAAVTSVSKPGTTPGGTHPSSASSVIETTTPVPKINATPQTSVPISTTLSIKNINMLTSSQGWATGLSAANSASVLITADGGNHWRDVTPPGIVSSAFISTFFLDNTRAWLALPSSDGAAITTYNTSDGGQSWQSGTPIELPNGGAGSLDFVDAQFGWFFVSLGTAQGSEAVELFRTTDGGMNWETVSLTSGDTNQSTSGSLPFPCTKNGVSFLNDSTGWASGSCTSGPLFFYKSQNTGISWQAQTPPPPQGYPQDLFSDCNCSTTKPEFQSAQNGVFMLLISGTTPGAFIYVTNDGGITWNPYPLPTNSPLAAPDFIDQSSGFITDGKFLYFSQDGGQNWNQVAKFPVTKLQSDLNFVNAKQGWFTVGNILYATLNGGKSWTEIQALIAPIPYPQIEQVVQIQPGSTTATFTVDLTAGNSQGYSLDLQSQQTIYIMKNGKARIEVIDKQKQPVLASTSQPGPLKVDIPSSGTYTILLEGENRTTVTLYLPAAGNPAQLPVPLPETYQHIGFYPGTSTAAIALNLPANAPLGYILNLKQGQEVDFSSSGDLNLAMIDSKNQVLPMVMPDRGVWQVSVPATGDYKLILLGSGQATLTVDIPGLNTSTGSSLLLPTTRTRLTIPAGGTSTMITTTLTGGTPQGFVLRIQENQRIFMVSSNDTITLTLLDPSNQPINLDHAAESDLWSTGIAQTGDYTLVLAGQGNVALTIYITTPQQTPPGPITPPRNTTQINLPNGNASATFSTTLTALQTQGYLLKLQKGQQLYITASGNATVGVLDPNGSALAIDHPNNSTIWSLAIPLSGNYTIVISGNGSTTVTVFSPPLASTTVAQSVPAPYKLTNIHIPKSDQAIAFPVTLQPNRAQGFVIQLTKGEQLNVSTTNGIHAGFLGPDGSSLPADHTQGSDLWSLSVQSSGSYTIVLSGSGSSTLTISILPAQS